MKKKLIFLMTLAAVVLLASCDYNEKYFGVTGASEDTRTSVSAYTITDGDLADIVKALRANKTKQDSAYAKALETDKVFSVNAPASYCIPFLLKNKFYGANKGSAAMVTYNLKHGSTGYYALTAADYAAVWNNTTVNALTPAKSVNTVAPDLLKNKYPNAVEGDVRTVEYQYAAQEPTDNTVTISAFEEDFEAYTAGSTEAVPTDNMFVLNKDLLGTYVWQCRTFSNNKYAQASSNRSTSDNEIWLVTKQIDLSEATDNATFSFDVTIGYYNADCLTVLVSENFDGTEAGVATATWTDATSNFTLPTEPASGYGTLGAAGTMDFKAYAGKKVYVAFKYVGSGISDPIRTTTYQIDNIKVGYTKTATSVPETKTQFATFKLQGGTWTPITKTFYQLTEQDYTEIGATSLSVAVAQERLPIFLKSKFPYAASGDSKVVVFKSGNANNADEYTFANGEWTPLSMVEQKTDQFVFSGWDVSGWVFDPTLYITMQKGKNDTDDYMMVVNYVKEKLASTTPSLIGSYGDAEYYYGFAAYYGNISLRESDRVKDPTYAKLTTQEEKDKYLEERTNEGLAVYLTLKFPDAPVQVSGIDVYAMVTTAIYDGVTTSSYIYKMQRVDAEPKWKFIERTKL